MTIRPLHRNLILAAVGLTLVGGAAISQTQPLPAVQWDVRRLDQLDRNVRRLERALTQRNSVGQPVLVEPDPEVIALQGQVGEMSRRLEDLQQAFQRMNGDNERVTFELDEANRANQMLRTRLEQGEGRIKALEDAMRAAAEAAAANGPVQADSPTGDAAGDLAAARQLATTDVARGLRALETVVVTWPNTPQGREASYRLGELRAANDDQAGAVQDYATALNGWPTTPWAAEATLRLATALVATERNSQACGALGEFNRRYAPTASANGKARAAQLRTRAGCS